MVVSNTMVFYSVAITYSIGKLEHGENPSFDVISYVWTLHVLLVFVMRFLIVTLVFFGAEVCVCQ